jgi:hypothetical protein
MQKQKIPLQKTGKAILTQGFRGIVRCSERLRVQQTIKCWRNVSFQLPSIRAESLHAQSQNAPSVAR